MAFRKIVMGTAVMSSVSMFRLLTQVFVVPVLSRFLSPADYGVVAMAMPFVVFTMFFSDAGVGQSLVRTPREESGVWSTSFWMTMGLGVCFAFAIAIMAPGAAWFFREPRLLAIVLAMSPTVFFQAGSTIPEAYLRQGHRFGVIAATEMAAVAASIASAVVIAIMGGGAWALVAQQLALYGVRFVLTFWFSAFRPRFTFDFGGLKEHLVFGRDVLAINFVGFLAQSADTFIIGRVLAATLLGLYTMAFMFARIPGRIISGPLQYVIYAHLAPLSKDKPLLRQTFLLLTRGLAAVIFPGMGMVAAAWHPTFKILLTDKWMDSGLLFMLATPAAAFQAVSGIRGAFMMAMGDTRTLFRSTVEFLAVLVCLLMVSVWFGISGAVIGYSCAVFLYQPRSMSLILPQLGCTGSSYFRTMTVPLAVTPLCMGVYWGITQVLAMGDWAQLFLGGALAVAGIGASALLQRRFLQDEIKMLRLLWSPVKEGG